MVPYSSPGRKTLRLAPPASGYPARSGPALAGDRCAVPAGSGRSGSRPASGGCPGRPHPPHRGATCAPPPRPPPARCARTTGLRRFLFGRVSASAPDGRRAPPAPIVTGSSWAGLKCSTHGRVEYKLHIPNIRTRGGFGFEGVLTTNGGVMKQLLTAVFCILMVSVSPLLQAQPCLAGEWDRYRNDFAFSASLDSHVRDST